MSKDKLELKQPSFFPKIHSGWLNLILWSIVPAVIVAFIAYLFGARRPYAIAFLVWAAFSAFSILIRDGEKF